MRLVERDKDWWLARAQGEAGHAVGAGGWRYGANEHQRVHDVVVLAAVSLGYQACESDVVLLAGRSASSSVKVEVELQWYRRWRKLLAFYFRAELKTRIVYWLAVLESPAVHAKVEVSFV